MTVDFDHGCGLLSPENQNDGWNPFKQMAPTKLCEGLKMAVSGNPRFLALSTRNFGTRSERQWSPTGMTRVPAAAAGNISAVAEAR